MFSVSEAYRPRPIGFLGVEELAGWRLKLYSIHYGDEAFERGAFEEGLALALPLLPAPPAGPHRPGVGFVIFHQGRGWNYLVLNWWDNENELFNRVLVRPRAGDSDTGAWRLAERGETVCVWDLQIIAFERDAYVETVLARAGGSPRLADYLAQRLDSRAPRPGTAAGA